MHANVSPIVSWVSHFKGKDKNEERTLASVRRQIKPKMEIMIL